MTHEILINVTPCETRAVLIEHGMPQEVQIERSHQKETIGNIYLGHILRVLPGIQAAFIDIGEERAAFLHVKDVPLKEGRVPHIQEVCVEGNTILVQVIRVPIGNKGARLTTRIKIPSRYFVLMPDEAENGVSLKIESEAERQRLTEIMNRPIVNETGHYIVRTAAEGISEETLIQNRIYLQAVWRHIQHKHALAKARECLYEELPFVLRTMRDWFSDSLQRIRVDNEEVAQQMMVFATQFLPQAASRIEYYDEASRPIFDLFNTEDELKRALERKVVLKSGGYLVIDQTEAMTTIDVNTGTFVGHFNQEETIYKTNLEAVSAIARQLRLRNLGGMIILDLIDMEDETHKRHVLKTFEKALAHDHAKTKVYDFSPLGLIEMTRKRTHDSLKNRLCHDCPTCEHRGMVKTPETVCYEIYREMKRYLKMTSLRRFSVFAHSVVVDYVHTHAHALFQTLHQLDSSLHIQFSTDSAFSQEQFDIATI